MAQNRMTNPPDALSYALRNAHTIIAAFDATTIGRATPLEQMEWIGNFSTALVLLVQAVEETPGLGGSSTRSMWPEGEPQSVRDAADSKGGAQ